MKFDNLNGYQLLIIPYQNSGYIRFFIGVFLLFWMGGWVIGFSNAANKLLSGQADAFLVFWLGGWTLGGLFASYMIIVFSENQNQNKYYLTGLLCRLTQVCPLYKLILDLPIDLNTLKIYFQNENVLNLIPQR